MRLLIPIQNNSTNLSDGGKLVDALLSSSDFFDLVCFLILRFLAMGSACLFPRPGTGTAVYQNRVVGQHVFMDWLKPLLQGLQRTPESLTSVLVALPYFRNEGSARRFLAQHFGDHAEIRTTLANLQAFPVYSFAIDHMQVSSVTAHLA